MYCAVSSDGRAGNGGKCGDGCIVLINLDARVSGGVDRWNRTLFRGGASSQRAGSDLPSSCNGAIEGGREGGHDKLDVSARLIEEVSEDCTGDYVGTLGSSAVDGLSNQFEGTIFPKLLFNDD